MTPTPTEQVRSPHLLRRLLAVVFGLALAGGLTTACSSDDSSNGTDNAGSNDAYPALLDLECVDPVLQLAGVDQRPQDVVVEVPEP